MPLFALFGDSRAGHVGALLFRPFEDGRGETAQPGPAVHATVIGDRSALEHVRGHPRVAGAKEESADADQAPDNHTNNAWAANLAGTGFENREHIPQGFNPAQAPINCNEGIADIAKEKSADDRH